MLEEFCWDAVCAWCIIVAELFYGQLGFLLCWCLFSFIPILCVLLVHTIVCSSYFIQWTVLTSVFENGKP